jgi:lipoprotein-releasing system permease protein
MKTSSLSAYIAARYEILAGLRYTRAKRRNRFISFISAISMVGITLGVATLITVLSVMNGFEQELREHLLGMTSHATISASNEGLSDWQAAATIATENPEVAAAAPYVNGEAMVRFGSKLSGVSVHGILPEREQKVSDIAHYLKSGSIDGLQAGSFDIVIGSELAKTLGAKVGDKIDLMVPQATITPAGIMPRYRRVTVAGIYEVGLYEFDRRLVLVPMHDAAVLYQMGDKVTGVRLRLHDLYRAPDVVRQVALKLPQLVYISDWTRQRVNYFKAVASQKQVMFVVLSLLVLIAVFNIVSTLVMVVEEKRADIAILRTLGASPRSIMAIFTVQGAVISLIGTLLGLILGIALALHANALVSVLEAVTGRHFIDPSVYNISDLPTRIDVGDVIRIALMALGLGLLSTLYPAWHASRLPPAEALRYE